MKIATIVGARPQFIKAATVSRAIRGRNGLRELLIHTGQHFDANMSEVFFEELDIPRPDHHLGIGGGSHGQNTGRMIEAIEAVLKVERPNWVLVYGDTDSTLAGALAAVKLHIPVAHVEAGLRSFNRRMPEEINRVLTDHAADLLFTPTDAATGNLKREGIGGDKVHQVGDVMFDATLFYRDRARQPAAWPELHGAPFVLSTMHRAENTNDPARLTAVVRTLNTVAKQMPLVLPLHPRTAAALRLADAEPLDSKVHLMEPVSYLEMVWLLSRCALVLTDSGGLQKEAYFHRKPCLTLRDETEWVELVEAGFNRLLAPTSEDVAVACGQMLGVAIPADGGLYGNGDAARKIVGRIEHGGADA